MSRRSYSPPARRRRPRCDTTATTPSTPSTSRSRNPNRHAGCEGDTCKDVEKKYGGFGWGEGIALALMGAVALFNVDKALDKDVQGGRSSSSSTTARGSQDKRRSRTGYTDRDRYGTSQRGGRDRSRERGGSGSRRSGRRGTW